MEETDTWKHPEKGWPSWRTSGATGSGSLGLAPGVDKGLTWWPWRVERGGEGDNEGYRSDELSAWGLSGEYEGQDWTSDLGPRVEFDHPKDGTSGSARETSGSQRMEHPMLDRSRRREPQYPDDEGTEMMKGMDNNGMTEWRKVQGSRIEWWLGLQYEREQRWELYSTGNSGTRVSPDIYGHTYVSFCIHTTHQLLPQCAVQILVESTCVL
jgi:hypothetical protein